ncbi:MAG: DUF2179 domain-containing protein [Spirochaetia bacterium]|nr:DUF2179 domain-containing protein [Spirochaetia bacterium]
MFIQDSILLALLIFVARVFDVSLGTFRHAMIIRSKRGIAFCIAFVESLIWVFAVSKVITNLTEPLTAFAFALGFASGTFVGITIESFLKIGEQVVKVFSVKGREVAAILRGEGFRVTEFSGQGRDGEVVLLFVQVRRREAKKVLKTARGIDKQCFLVVEDIKFVDSANL